MQSSILNLFHLREKLIEVLTLSKGTVHYNVKMEGDASTTNVDVERVSGVNCVNHGKYYIVKKKYRRMY